MNFNFLNLCDDIIGMVSDEVKNHPRYKFRNTLKDINYHGLDYKKDDACADYEEIMMNLWNRVGCSGSYWVSKRLFNRVKGCMVYKEKKSRLLNYWEMRFIDELNGGHGLSIFHRFQNQQLENFKEVFDRIDMVRMFKILGWERPGYIFLQYITDDGIKIQILEDEPDYPSSDEEPDWDDEGHPY